MSLDWMAIENSFPSFTGSESAHEMAQKLLDYMYKLTNQLKYTLQNLDMDNWNKNALNKYSQDTTKDLNETVRQMSEQMANLSTTLNGVSARLAQATLDLEKAQTELTYLQDAQERSGQQLTQVQTQAVENRQDIDAHAKQLAVINERLPELGWLAADLQALDDSVQALLQMISAGEDALTIGADGKRIDLVGQIYINGVLYS